MGGPQMEMGGPQMALGGIEDEEIRLYAWPKPLGRKDKRLWMDRLNCMAEMASKALFRYKEERKRRIIDHNFFNSQNSRVINGNESYTV